MTQTEQIVLAVQKHPGKTAGELSELTGLNDRQVASALATAIRRSYIIRKRRMNTVRNPNVGLWEYYP